MFWGGRTVVAAVRLAPRAGREGNHKEPVSIVGHLSCQGVVDSCFRSPLRNLQKCLSAANFTPSLTFPHQGGRDFQVPIRRYAKVSPVSWYGAGSTRE